MSNRHYVFIVLSYFSLLCFLTNVHAIPLSYDESESGDLDGQQILALEVGTNTVTGTFSAWYDGGYSADFDSFGFIVGAGNSISSVKLDISNSAGEIGIYHTLWQLFETGSGTRLSSAPIPIPSSELSIYLDAIPLGSGAYEMRHSVINFFTPFEWSEVAYTFSFELAGSAVPEPGSFFLVGIGLIGFFGWRRFSPK